jgi:S-adenosylmethionine synthetase
MQEEFHSSESVTGGHPDKVCDQIVNQILDDAIKASLPFGGKAHLGMEASVKGSESGGTTLLFGEVTLPSGVTLDYEDIARRTVAEIGYMDSASGFHAELPDLRIVVSQQSAEINNGVSRKRTGAGDQGLMFGGAIDETPSLMPMPIAIAHDLTDIYTYLYNNGISWLRPDAKSQVVLRYENGKPVAVKNVIIAASHDPLVEQGAVRDTVIKEMIIPILDRYNLRLEDPDSQVIVNGAGPWTIYGPLGDAGTTNRKIIVDSYGGRFAHGGGGFNGKDPTKVDVAGAVGARYVAKALVAEKLARKVQIEVCYVIGQPDPLAIQIDTFGTGTKPQHMIEDRAHEILDLSVDGIIDGLNLFQPIYRQASVGGWFGRDIFPWEQTPKQ